MVFVGEAMLELSRALEAETWSLGYGGDTLNTAIHLARMGHRVSYLTALGEDPLSQSLCQKWQAEGLDTSLVLRHPSRTTGLYSITNDEAGERSFSYWRDTSAARDLFSLADIKAAIEIAQNADLLGFSLISLAILPKDGRARLLDLAQGVRSRGGKVAFDGNYRPRLWNNPKEAAALRDAAIEIADIGLPTLDDEQLLSGHASADAVADHWQGLGCRETIVKLGPLGCRLPNGSVVRPPEALKPVDTSGAGDAFNAGYLAARLAGDDLEAAALSGHRLAGWTIMRAGAIPRQDEG